VLKENILWRDECIEFIFRLKKHDKIFDNIISADVGFRRLNKTLVIKFVSPVCVIFV